MSDNIDDLRAVNRHLRLALDQVSDGAMILSAGELEGEGPQIVYANAGLCSMVGRGESDVIGTRLGFVVDQEDLGLVLRRMGEIGETGGALIPEIRVVGPRGRSLSCKGNVVVTRSIKDGGVLNYTISLRESWKNRVEGRGEAPVIVDAEVADWQEDIVEKSRMETLALMAGGIAHDFNNILTGIIANLSLALPIVEEDKLGVSDKAELKKAENLVSYLRKAERASQSAQSISQKLLSFSKGRTAKKDEADVAEIVRGSVEISTLGSNCRCEVSIDEALRVCVVDQTQISQVFNNLVINAWQAMPEGGVVQVDADNVVIEEGGEQPAGNYVRVEVRDRGCGIKEADLERIFDPFYTTKPGGSGYGLATCNTVIHEHGGFIDVKSSVGFGTTFSVYIPSEAKIAKADSKIVPMTGVSDEQEEEAKSDARCTVLVVDDFEPVRNVAMLILKELGYDVAAATTGNDAIDLYTSRMRGSDPIGVVLMDMTLPGGLDGRVAAKEIRSQDSSARIVAMSGFFAEEEKVELRAEGYVGVLPKPFKMQDLSDVISEAVASTPDAPSARAAGE